MKLLPFIQGKKTPELAPGMLECGEPRMAADA